MIDADVFDFIERCEAHKGPEQILDDLLKTVKVLGFSHLILSGVPIGGQKLSPMVELMGWPDGWFERYVDRSYAEVDGVCLFSGKTLHPFYWDDVPPRLANTPASRKVDGEATEFGIRSGYAVPMLSVRHWQSVLSLASNVRHLRLSKREESQVVTMATYAGAAVQSMAYGQVDWDTLSDREREVLLWIAEGKTAWETSQILAISEATVRFHIAKAKEALALASTTQAVVEAIRRRLIHP